MVLRLVHFSRVMHVPPHECHLGVQVGRAMYEENLLLGFSVPPLIRFVGEEEAFLSNANGGPRIFFNIEDHQSYQTGMPNVKFNVRNPSMCQS